MVNCLTDITNHPNRFSISAQLPDKLHQDMGHVLVFVHQDVLVVVEVLRYRTAVYYGLQGWQGNEVGIVDELVMT
ncbi:hypothetical protein D3C75_1286690 [compost metagenome]